MELQKYKRGKIKFYSHKRFHYFHPSKKTFLSIKIFRRVSLIITPLFLNVYFLQSSHNYQNVFIYLFHYISKYTFKITFKMKFSFKNSFYCDITIIIANVDKHFTFTISQKNFKNNYKKNYSNDIWFYLYLICPSLLKNDFRCLPYPEYLLASVGIFFLVAIQPVLKDKDFFSDLIKDYIFFKFEKENDVSERLIILQFY